MQMAGTVAYRSVNYSHAEAPKLPLSHSCPILTMSNPTLQEAPPGASTSVWEDFIDIFYAPRQVFERRRGAKYGLVLLVITVVVTVLFFASQGPLADAYAAEFQRGMANSNQEMSAEQMAQAQRMGSIFGTVAVLVAFPIGVLLIGLVLWGLGKLFGFAATAGMAILIVTYAQFPRVLQSVVVLLQGFILNPDSLAAVTLGPARFLDPNTTSAITMALLMRLDLFYIWSTILIAIGAQVIGRVPKVQSYVLAALVWVVGAVPGLVGALAS